MSSDAYVDVVCNNRSFVTLTFSEDTKRILTTEYDYKINEYGYIPWDRIINNDILEVIKRLGNKTFNRCLEPDIYRIPIEFKDCYERIIDSYDETSEIELRSEALVKHKFSDIDIDSLSIEQQASKFREIIKILKTKYHFTKYSFDEFLSLYKNN